MANLEIKIASIQLHLKRRKSIILPPSTSPQRPDWREPLFHALGLLGIYILFYGIIWVWTVLGDDGEGKGKGVQGVWEMWEGEKELEARIGVQGVVRKLAGCLGEETVRGRNATATVEDVVGCLRGMGMENG
jgi:hypothetical protein